MKQTDDTLILASQSPRRRYLLTKAGLTFTVVPSEVDESSLPVSAPAHYAQELAQAKALDVAEAHPDAWVIGADTIVLIDDLILGKPDSVSHAREMLQRLSGRVHQVITGFCLVHKASGKKISEAVTTEVLFKELSASEIEWYLQTREPVDKAGAYAIQGFGSFLVRSITGSYSNVVGLPVCEVMECLVREKLVTFEQPTPVSEAENVPR